MKNSFSLLAVAVAVMTSTQARAQVDTSAFHQALKLKKNLYYDNDTVTGGDRNSNDFRVTAIRVAPQPAGYDRIVIDLSGNELGESSKLARPPYFQVEVNSSMKVVHATIYGKPKLEFSTKSTAAAAKKAKNISKFSILPVVDGDRWTFSIQLQPDVKAEVFELTEPARIIIDLKH